MWMYRRGLKFFTFTVVSIVFLLSLSYTAMQTKWFKDYIHSTIQQQTEPLGINVSWENITGSLPFSFHVDNLKVTTKEGSLKVRKAQLNVSLLSLLTQRLVFKEISLHSASYTLPNKSQDSVSAPPSPPPSLFSELPFTIVIKKFECRDALIQNSADHIIFKGNLGGSLYLPYQLNKISGNLNIAGSSPYEVNLSLDVEGNQTLNKLRVSVKGSTSHPELISTLGIESGHGSVSGDAFLEGSFDSWSSLLSDTEHNQSLSGKLRLHLNSSSFPFLPKIEGSLRISSDVVVLPDKSLLLKHAFLSCPVASFEGNLLFSPALGVKAANCQYKIKELNKFDENLSGELDGKILYDNEQLSLEISSSSILAFGQALDSFKSELKMKKDSLNWAGYTKSTFWMLGESYRLSSDIQTKDFCQLKLYNARLTSTPLDIIASLDLDITEGKMQGEAFIQSQDLSPLKDLFKAKELKGSLGAEIKFEHSIKNADDKHYNLDLALKNLKLNSLYVKEMSLSLALKDLIHFQGGDISLETKGVIHELGEIESFDLFLSSVSKEWQYETRTKGKWKDPFELYSAGGFSFQENRFHLEIASLDGTILKQWFHSEKPLILTFDPDYLILENMDFKLSEGRLKGFISLSPSSSNIKILAEHIPVDLLSLINPEFNIIGTSSFNLIFEGTPSQAKGSFHLLLDESRFTTPHSSTPVKTKGSIQATYDNNKLQISSDFYASNDQYFMAKATIPIAVQTFPLKAEILKDENICGDLIVEGKIEELFDFINLGTHHLSGYVSGHLFLSNKLSLPVFTGEVELQNGGYENYFTGTLLHNLHARVTAEKNRISIEELVGSDGKRGYIFAKGALILDFANSLPYQLDVELDNLNTVKLDSLSARVSGKLAIKGDLNEALASGNLTVNKAEMMIPESLPEEVPTLELTWINAPKIEKSTLATPSIYPVKLDIHIEAPNQVYLRGRGLNCELQGNIDVKGTNIELLPTGSLSLLKGEFLFAGKYFNLTQGEVTFTDKKDHEAWLSLTGSLNMPDLTVFASLKGPLIAPTLSFYSMPTLPTSSLLARVLFNKDISEITPFQAVQLANMIVTLSGGAGPDVLEKIRKSLGIDRLNIVSTPKGESEDVSVQIGKYLARGVLVTLSQSAESSSVIVEVDLKHGFIFQAETQDREEGKFTLKWNLNY